jgi:hypothetical protein
MVSKLTEEVAYLKNDNASMKEEIKCLLGLMLQVSYAFRLR